MAVLRTDVSEECNTSVIRLARIGQLGTMLAVTSGSPILVIPETRLFQIYQEKLQDLGFKREKLVVKIINV
jgi:hypothetical protein